jgi:membrane protease YdiL (CAAX protease family)
VSTFARGPTQGPPPDDLRPPLPGTPPPLPAIPDAPPADPPPDPVLPPPDGPSPPLPPGGGIFSLEGRAGPSLYLMAWILSVGGIALLLLIGPLASTELSQRLLMALGAALAALGLAFACGYQVLARRDRVAERYRGPSPLLVFGTFFFAVAAAGLLLIPSGAAEEVDPIAFLAIGAMQAMGFALVVWLFVVRSGALSWRQMGWPTWPGHSVLGSIGASVVVILPTTLLLLIVGGLIGRILGVEAPTVLPTTDDRAGRLVVAAAAAVVIPIGEELFFRGFALTAWLRDLGPRAALVRSSLFFALIHIANINADFWTGARQAVLTVAIILPVGFVLGWLFLRRGMAAAIGGHIAYNGLLLVLVELAGGSSQG